MKHLSNHQNVLTRKYVKNGLELDIPTYMWDKRDEIVDFIFRKLLERLINREKGAPADE